MRTRGADERFLVDSSVWIELLRANGDRAARENLSRLIEENQAVWCDMVRLELWRGAGSASDRGLLRDYEADVPTLEINREVWDKSCALAQLCCSKGRPLPATDLLIYACAIVHGVDLLHRDQHFDVLERLYPR